mmetsp:Transcript_136525/g.323348  ORF Transcript_136525/g.323348 Transcript_136525/m.323348 type:complete len:83 (+) Transcript_136525:261-509(+)
MVKLVCLCGGGMWSPAMTTRIFHKHRANLGIGEAVGICRTSLAYVILRCLEILGGSFSMVVLCQLRGLHRGIFRLSASLFSC